jgi:hypothetical protein
MEADIDPEVLTVMARAGAGMEASARSEFDDNLARAQAGAEQLAEQRAHAQAERERAVINEPAGQAQAQAELEATGAAGHAEVDDLEIGRRNRA